MDSQRWQKKDVQGTLLNTVWVWSSAAANNINGLLPSSFAIVAAWCCWAISCFLCGTCWAEAAADPEPSCSCAWIDTSPVLSCFSPVPDTKSSLLIVHDFLQDGKWHDKLKHSQKNLEAAGFYFYMDLTCHLSVLSVVSGWQLNISLVIFCGCCLQHFAFRRWPCKNSDLFRQSHQPLKLSLCSFSFWIICSPRCILCICTRTLGTNQLGFHLWYIKKTHSSL